jgi:hypothetical protein
MLGPRFTEFAARLSSLAPLWGIFYVTLLPVVFARYLLLGVLRSGVPRAWDGTGHYGIAQIYAQTIFPDTFGWTHSHFGGMPFPNFYPPLFFWVVSLIERTHLVSFLTAFKSVVLLPLMLVPAAIWLLAWSVSNHNKRVAFLSSLASVYPLISWRFGGQMQWASGLDYFSTISVGMYTQPLGFVLLLAWYAVYAGARRPVWRFSLATLLLALAVLANFLNGITATIFIAATLLFDLLRLRSVYARDKEARREALRTSIAHTLSPVLSAGLTLFWLMPMLSTYRYFVTRPFTMVIFTPEMMVWFALAAAGFVCWLRRPTQATAAYFTACLTLAAFLIFAASAAPRWLPLQANRFSPTLYLLLTAPVGYLFLTIYESVRDAAANRLPRARPVARRIAPYVFIFLLLLPMWRYYTTTKRPNARFFQEYQARLAFYPSTANQPAPLSHETAGGAASTVESFAAERPADVDRERLVEALKRDHERDEAIAAAAISTINSILGFANEHRDGRYLVEIPRQYSVEAASFDGRALNSYLGAQGNQTLTVVYREASPNSIFMFPQVGAFSYNPDNFGFSSVLGDDLDFAAQPLAKHIERIRYLGARYLVINSPGMKERLSAEPAVGERHDFGSWTVFALREPPPPAIRALQFRPALLVSDITVKGRRNNESSFIRFAEEQFADGWFDVPLVRVPAKNLDLLGDATELNQFGALILDSYDCDRCELVYRQLKAFSQNRKLILLMSDESLFNRIRYSLNEFPMATVIERDIDADPGAWLENFGPTRHYGSSPFRQQWAQIRQILEGHKVPVDSPVPVSGSIERNSIRLVYDSPVQPELGVPVLVSTSYHPNWQGEQSQTIYAVNPMFMLVFLRHSTSLTYARRQLDLLAVWVSAATLLGLFGITCWSFLSGIVKARRSSSRAVVTSLDAPLEQPVEASARTPLQEPIPRSSSAD